MTKQQSFDPLSVFFKCNKGKIEDHNQVECRNNVTHIDYVSRIVQKKKPFVLKHPDKILVTPSSKLVALNIPKISLKEKSFNIQEVKLTSQPILGDVKKQLQILSQQLSAMNTLPGVADGWIQLLQKELEKCPAQPHADEAKKIIAAFRQNLIDARGKITAGQGASGEIFKAAAGFVPCLFLILGLLAAATTASGAAKLFVRRQKKDDNAAYNNDTTQQSVQQQQAMCEQSTSVDQQS